MKNVLDDASFRDNLERAVNAGSPRFPAPLQPKPVSLICGRAMPLASRCGAVLRRACKDNPWANNDVDGKVKAPGWEARAGSRERRDERPWSDVTTPGFVSKDEGYRSGATGFWYDEDRWMQDKPAGHCLVADSRRNPQQTHYNVSGGFGRFRNSRRMPDA